MKLKQAEKIAGQVVEQLDPHCERIEIAGSIRRGKAEPNDIEIVCVPKSVSYFDLIGYRESCRPNAFITTVKSFGKIIKGDPWEGKYTQIDLGKIKLDLFCARLENWGLILAIRTGSRDFSHHILASGWVQRGYKSVDGMLTKNGKPVPVYEERELFELAGVKWVEPEQRQ